jgi:hypothetical protein
MMRGKKRYCSNHPTSTWNFWLLGQVGRKPSIWTDWAGGFVRKIQKMHFSSDLMVAPESAPQELQMVK